MNRDVFLSILAMDAYQRGYSPGISQMQGSAIGTAVIRRDSSVLIRDGERLDQPVGFYAVSYDWNGETVISYRGTDFDVANDFVRSDGTLARIEKAFNSEFFKDLTRGWGAPHP